MEYMKAIAVMGPNDIRVVDDVPKPVLGDYEALVKVHACGFCNGTDMQIITGTGGDLGNSVSIYPTVLGHEGAGEVVAVGKKVRHIHVGERWLHPNLYPDVGNGYTKTHGSMAEYGMVSDNQAMLEDGFAEKDFPWVKQHKLALSLFCGLRGGHVTQIDRIQERLEMSKRIAKTEHTINSSVEDVDAVLNGKKFDVAIDIVGFTDIIYEASRHVKPGGKVGSMGVLRSNDLVVDTSRLQNNTSLHMLNFPYGEYAILDETIALIEAGKVNPKDFYSHVLPYEKIEEAVQLTLSKQALKVILDFDA